MINTSKPRSNTRGRNWLLSLTLVSGLFSACFASAPAASSTHFAPGHHPGSVIIFVTLPSA